MVRLSCACRRVADAPCGHVDVLLAQGVHDIAGGQVPPRELAGIQPETHRKLSLAKDDDVSHAGDALQSILHVDIEVVRDEEGVIRAVFGPCGGCGDEAPAAFLNGDADLADLSGQTAERLVHSILHIHRGDVGIAGHLERHDDLADAAVGARGGDVEHALHAIDRLFERCRDGGFNRFRVGACIDRGHRYGGWRHLGVLRDRHRRDRERTCEHDDERADAGQDGSGDERIDEHQETFTGAPSPSFWTFETMTVHRP